LRGAVSYQLSAVSLKLTLKSWRVLLIFKRQVSYEDLLSDF